MQYEILGGDSYSAVRMTLGIGETVKAESNAMIAMSGGVQLKGKMDGGFGRAFSRMFSGESFFMQQATAQRDGEWITFAGSAPGEILPLELDGSTQWAVQKNGFLAGGPGVDVSTKVQSLAKAMFSREGLFVVKIGGKGTVFLSDYGAIMPITLKEGEEVLVDNGHLLAWPTHMNYKITKGARGWVSAFTSGELLACRFRGPGTIYIQTRSARAFGFWMTPFIIFPRQQRGQ